MQSLLNPKRLGRGCRVVRRHQAGNISQSKGATKLTQGSFARKNIQNKNCEKYFLRKNVKATPAKSGAEYYEKNNNLELQMKNVIYSN